MQKRLWAGLVALALVAGCSDPVDPTELNVFTGSLGGLWNCTLDFEGVTNGPVEFFYEGQARYMWIELVQPDSTIALGTWLVISRLRLEQAPSLRCCAS